MWTKSDWQRASISAAMVFGVTLVGFYPARVTADDPAPVASTIKIPTLTIDGVSITAASVKGAGVLSIANGTVFVQPGLLPPLELQASNQTDEDKSIELAGSLLTSRVGNPMTRVPMPAQKPTSVWKQDMTFNLKPGEVKILRISPNVKLATMSSAGLILQAGDQKINVLTLSTAPNMTLMMTPVTVPKAAPTTRPAGSPVVLGPAAPRR